MIKIINIYNNIIKEQWEEQFAIPDEDNTADRKQASGVLIYARATNKFLLIKRSIFVLEPLSWGIVSGKIDKGESPLEAAKREIREELKVTGIEINPTPIYIYNGKKLKFYNFIGFAQNEFKPKLNWENTRFAWVSLDEMKKLRLHFGVKDLLSKININKKVGADGSIK